MKNVIEGLLQPTHLALILVIGLIVFGPGKLAELGGQLGRGVREFRTNMDAGANDAAAVRTFCTACGAERPSGATYRFCSACGASQA
ncbi:MAG TPA: twin-arginine translocase TatA/TatE family subunit [Candidatus Limnocylindria bacterium]